MESYLWSQPWGDLCLTEVPDMLHQADLGVIKDSVCVALEYCMVELHGQAKNRAYHFFDQFWKKLPTFPLRHHFNNNLSALKTAGIKAYEWRDIMKAIVLAFFYMPEIRWVPSPTIVVTLACV